MVLFYRAAHAPLTVLLSSALLSSVSLPALAQDWTGFYVGANGGVDAITGDITVATPGGTLEASGLGGGDLGLTVRVGADYQINSWFVVGAFAQYDWSDIDTKVFVTDGINTASAELLRLDQAWAVGGRAGVLLTPSILAYGLLGYTEVEFADITLTAPGIAFAFELPKGQGLMTGGGFEHRISSTLSVTGEYRVSFFEEQTIADIGGIPITGDAMLHAGRVGLAYRFGHSSEAPDEASDPTASAQAWTGLYVGAGLGADAIAGDLDVNAPALGAFAKASGLGGGDLGFVGTLGYDFQALPNVVIGPFVTLDKSVQDVEISASALGQSFTVGLPGIDTVVTGGARLGVLVSPDAMIYGLAGYSQVDFQDIEASAAGVGSVALESPSFKGVTFGGGVEHLLGHDLSVRAEYRYIDVDSQTIFELPGVATASVDPDLHVARVLLSYRPSSFLSGP